MSPYKTEKIKMIGQQTLEELGLKTIMVIGEASFNPQLMFKYLNNTEYFECENGKWHEKMEFEIIKLRSKIRRDKLNKKINKISCTGGY